MSKIKKQKQFSVIIKNVLPPSEIKIATERNKTVHNETALQIGENRI